MSNDEPQKGADGQSHLTVGLGLCVGWRMIFDFGSETFSRGNMCGAGSLVAWMIAHPFANSHTIGLLVVDSRGRKAEVLI